MTEEWNLEGLVTEASTYWPMGLGVDRLEGVDSTDTVYELLVDDALSAFERREAELDPTSCARSSAR